MNSKEELIKHINSLEELQIIAICDFLGITDNIEIAECPECSNIDVRDSDIICNKCGYHF